MASLSEVVRAAPRWRWDDAVESPMHYVKRIAALADPSLVCSDGCECCVRAERETPQLIGDRLDAYRSPYKGD